jgi:hypothetical protein
MLFSKQIESIPEFIDKQFDLSHLIQEPVTMTARLNERISTRVSAIRPKLEADAPTL